MASVRVGTDWLIFASLVQRTHRLGVDGCGTIVTGNVWAMYHFVYENLSLIPALCNEDPNGNVPLGKSCNRYWQCQGGYPRLQRCPAMLVFDRRSLRCVVPPTEDCEIPTTTTPLPDEDDVRPVILST